MRRTGFKLPKGHITLSNRFANTHQKLLRFCTQVAGKTQPFLIHICNLFDSAVQILSYGQFWSLHYGEGARAEFIGVFFLWKCMYILGDWIGACIYSMILLYSWILLILYGGKCSHIQMKIWGWLYLSGQTKGRLGAFLKMTLEFWFYKIKALCPEANLNGLIIGKSKQTLKAVSFKCNLWRGVGH